MKFIKLYTNSNSNNKHIYAHFRYNILATTTTQKKKANTNCMCEWSLQSRLMSSKTFCNINATEKKKYKQASKQTKKFYKSYKNDEKRMLLLKVTKRVIFIYFFRVYGGVKCKE